jgi:hypothetical protein
VPGGIAAKPLEMITPSWLMLLAVIGLACEKNIKVIRSALAADGVGAGRPLSVQSGAPAVPSSSLPRFNIGMLRSISGQRRHADDAVSRTAATSVSSSVR